MMYFFHVFIALIFLLSKLCYTSIPRDVDSVAQGLEIDGRVHGQGERDLELFPKIDSAGLDGKDTEGTAESFEDKLPDTRSTDEPEVTSNLLTNADISSASSSNTRVLGELREQESDSGLRRTANGRQGYNAWRPRSFRWRPPGRRSPINRNLQAAQRRPEYQWSQHQQVAQGIPIYTQPQTTAYPYSPYHIVAYPPLEGQHMQLVSAPPVTYPTLHSWTATQAHYDYRTTMQPATQPFQRDYQNFIHYDYPHLANNLADPRNGAVSQPANFLVTTPSTLIQNFIHYNHPHRANDLADPWNGVVPQPPNFMVTTQFQSEPSFIPYLPNPRTEAFPQTGNFATPMPPTSNPNFNPYNYQQTSSNMAYSGPRAVFQPA